MSHTPGPWKHITPRLDKPRDKIIDIRAANGLTIASVWEYTHDSRDDQRDDARLIAAAPELLMACKEAKAWIDTLEDGEYLTEVLRAAIEKAVGE